ncbi:MAG: succinate--CoA ligase subunit alpha [Chloroflexi bacterium AL-W]|nr:succinate--CoA ligase subunit alpha [Chloroflexi bacterium AL-N1]NOK65340.1 succinate--CoA ligase subunit alpha [Chloroflexi bacterium AL-N10]NOK72395.1 succinate--CoA ligase subunit alpha [Chloroflexi bacterium AL-N5]NOK79519.1 succinate--CoA ligase subunit alpha [Chloroflexi bacterium AL-W]NOK87435.1 succinate--CoA ligase subunit alpha [Chloroflexi bacterium AL-N15]
MSILVDKNTRLAVQGITGNEGTFHARAMIEYGTNIVAGVTPGKGGLKAVDNQVPVFNTVEDAVKETGANVSVIYVPAHLNAADSVREAAAAGIALVVCITEGVPANDMVSTVAFVKEHGSRLIGPNCPGLLTPGEAKVGIIPGNVATPGPVGVVSKSGTLTYEAVDALTRIGLGQSTIVGIGGDPIIGTSFIDVLELFQADPKTEAIVLIGEIGGTAEQDAATYIKQHVTKPVVSFIAGQTAPPGKRMGHAGAIISGGEGTAAEKVAALEAVGAKVAKLPTDIAQLVKDVL